MRLIKTITSIVSIFLLRSFFLNSIHGFTPIVKEITQDHFKHEIFDVYVDRFDLVFEGYGFVIEQQHYRNILTHSIAIEMIDSKGKNRRYEGVSQASNYTDHIKYRGTSLCGMFTLRQPNQTCHYTYENVQFKVRIPLSLIETHETYVFNLISHPRSVNVEFKTPIYAILDKNEFIHNERIFIFHDHEQRNSLQVMHSEVVVRTQPSITGPVLYQGDYCSSTYKNQLFYKLHSVFNHIHSVMFNHSIGLTYYELKGQISECHNQRRTIVEGNNIEPIFINRLMVRLDGDRFKMSVTIPKPSIRKILIRYYHPLYTNHVRFNEFLEIMKY